MITNLKFENCFTFDKLVEMNLRADMRAKKFPSNICMIDNGINYLKSAVIYGPNNTGKTSIINCVKAIKGTLENKEVWLNSNIFTGSNICYEYISFVYKDKEYYYEYKIDVQKHLYVYEKMAQIKRDDYKNESEEVLFVRDTINNYYSCPKDKNLENILNIASSNNILIYTLQVDKFDILKEIKKILVSIANDIEIIDMNKIPNSKTIQILKNKDEETKKIVDFIKNADINLDDYIYDEKIKFEFNEKEIEDKVLKNQNLVDQIKLISVYKGKPVPSIIFDSLGTRKIVALASYIITTIENGKTLLVDELDSSLHFKLTRAIVSMFNNEVNSQGQLIATLHDVSLLDCKKLFRKEQIFFTSKDKESTKLYSLKEFSYDKSGVRDTSDVQEKYSKGLFGAIPEPDLVSTLLEGDNINNDI